MNKCEECSGKGAIVICVDPDNWNNDIWESCDECEGTGKIIEKEPDLDPYPNRLWPEVEMN